MNTKNEYNKTIRSCFVAYIVQAIVNNFVPLLFLTFQRTYDIPLSQITMLITFNFGVQLLVDLLSVSFVDRLGYRFCMVLAHILSAAGLIFLTVLPEILPSAFAGILIAVMIYAIGGGLLEVLVSPVVESCPSDNKEKAMSMLHSFYCWGHVGVVLISTVFFSAFGITNWKILAVLWAIVPLVNAAAFTKVPLRSLMEEGETGLSLKELLTMKTFWILLVMMICAGASEQGVSQWASTLAERPWHHKDGRRPCRPDGVCGFDGNVAGILWKIRGQDLAGLFYGAEQSAVYCFLPGYFSAWDASVKPGLLCVVRTFCWYHVAGNVQQGSGCASKGWYCDVCASGAWR